ncbi:RimJ/RimL family protein N-acetyltransferase [Clostridium punense]|uniref:RimJ/RimL family protein N-acetyltransferase n=1 Tax=Clostridium punense TaxID=1054297 RepID=A0ABS4K4Q2_9CLOT|nr:MULTISPECIES: GNAT family N-acetyltransferase [Clostridium]MBP2022757.1 RimJ/RimL family protein N-acetyltransferase [Clostridium punense]
MKNENTESEFRIFNGDIFLRDMCMQDINDYIIWNTTEVEWQDWDAPWEKEEVNIEDLKNSLLKRLNKTVPEIRRRLEICTVEGSHIGWVSSYNIDGNKERLAVGIDIPSKSYRGKNMGKSALILFISYLLKAGFLSDIYTQTWSGNYRMISLAESCGFKIVASEMNCREVRGSRYHGLTFKLNKDLFWDRFKHLE